MVLAVGFHKLVEFRFHDCCCCKAETKKLLRAAATIKVKVIVMDRYLGYSKPLRQWQCNDIDNGNHNLATAYRKGQEKYDNRNCNDADMVIVVYNRSVNGNGIGNSHRIGSGNGIVTAATMGMAAVMVISFNPRSEIVEKASEEASKKNA